MMNLSSFLPFFFKSSLIQCVGSSVQGMSGQRCNRSPLGGRLAMMFVDRYFHHYYFHLARAVGVAVTRC